VPEKWLKTYGTDVKGWVCDDGRAKWHDLLVRGKVDVVISGHTHTHAWFGPKEGRPYGQLVGGGPKPADARVIEGRADAKGLEIVMRRLDGEVVVRERIGPKTA
jgi:3',5'-cyclic AMP phosphodiesterase CpdA